MEQSATAGYGADTRGGAEFADGAGDERPGIAESQ